MYIQNSVRPSIISSIFSSNSEANALELLENIEDLPVWFIMALNIRLLHMKLNVLLAFL